MLRVLDYLWYRICQHSETCKSSSASSISHCFMKTCSDRLPFRFTQHVLIPKWRNRFIASDPQDDKNDLSQRCQKRAHQTFVVTWLTLWNSHFFLWWGPAGFTLASKAQKALVLLLLLIVQVSLLSLRGENVKRQSEFTCTQVFYGLTASQEKPAGSKEECVWRPLWLSSNELLSSRVCLVWFCGCILSACYSFIALFLCLCLSLLFSIASRWMWDRKRCEGKVDCGKQEHV